MTVRLIANQMWLMVKQQKIQYDYIFTPSIFIIFYKNDYLESILIVRNVV